MTSTRTSKLISMSSQKSIMDGFPVKVRLLENDNSFFILVPESANGRWLLEEVCKHQDVLPEIEYFGLRYISCDLLSSPSKHWMNPTKPVKSQLKHTNPLIVSFRIKHYPPDPFNDFKLDKSKYLLFHQLHRDFLNGRLIAPHDDIIHLAALFIQVTLGDASEMGVPEPNFQPSATLSSENSSTYLSNYRALHNTSSKKNEMEILAEHRKLEGLLPSEAAAEVIRTALRQLSYGLEPFKVQPTKRKNARPVHIGLTHEGVAEFRGGKRSQLYKWSDIDQFFYSGKTFILSCRKATAKNRKPSHETVEYRCESRAIAAELWSWALERKLFFTLEKSSVAKPITTKYNLFSRRHTFNFAGRCRSELVNSNPSLEVLPNCSREKTTTAPGHLHSHSHHHQHRHQHYQHQRQSSRGSTLSSVETRLVGSKSMNEFNSHDTISTSSVAQSIPVEEERVFGELSGSLAASEQESVSTASQPTFVKLAPYFESIPNRKYASLSRIRQQRCVSLAHDPASRSQRSMDDLLLDGILGQPITETWEPTTEVKKCAPDYRTPNSLPKVDELGTDAIDNEPIKDKENIPCPKISPLWRYALVTGGISVMVALCVSLASDFGVQLFLPLPFRSSPLFVKWDSYCYRPLRSLLLGIFQ